MLAFESDSQSRPWWDEGGLLSITQQNRKPKLWRLLGAFWQVTQTLGLYLPVFDVALVCCQQQLPKNWQHTMRIPLGPLAVSSLPCTARTTDTNGIQLLTKTLGFFFDEVSS